MPYLLKKSCHEVNLACRCTTCLCTGGNEADTILSAAGFYWLLIYTPETPYVASNTTHTHMKKKKRPQWLICHAVDRLVCKHIFKQLHIKGVQVPSSLI